MWRGRRRDALARTRATPPPAPGATERVAVGRSVSDRTLVECLFAVYLRHASSRPTAAALPPPPPPSHSTVPAGGGPPAPPPPPPTPAHGKVCQPAEHPAASTARHSAELPRSSTIHCRHRNEHLSLFQIWWCRMCSLPPPRHCRPDSLRQPCLRSRSATTSCSGEWRCRADAQERVCLARAPLLCRMLQGTSCNAAARLLTWACDAVLAVPTAESSFGVGAHAAVRAALQVVTDTAQRAISAADALADNSDGTTLEDIVSAGRRSRSAACGRGCFVLACRILLELQCSCLKGTPTVLCCYVLWRGR